MNNLDLAHLVGNLPTRRIAPHSDLNDSNRRRSPDTSRRRRLQDAIQEALDLVSDIDFNDDEQEDALPVLVFAALALI